MSQLLKTRIELDGWWGRESALIKKGTLLYKLKFYIIEELIRYGIIKESDIDNTNNTTHIKITNILRPKDPDVYSSINGRNISISRRNINLKKDLIEVIFHEIPLLHMLIVYHKSLGDKRSQIIPVIDHAFNMFISAVADGAPKDPDDESTICTVCCVNKRDCCLIPCGHICICYDCSKSIHDKKCPICRREFKEAIKTFVS
jgi:hypothetical protein